MKARTHFAAGEYKQALDIYARLYAETMHPTYLRNIARCHQNLGDADKAISSFREYLRKARDLTARSARRDRGLHRRDGADEAREGYARHQRRSPPAAESRRRRWSARPPSSRGPLRRRRAWGRSTRVSGSGRSWPASPPPAPSVSTRSPRIAAHRTARSASWISRTDARAPRVRSPPVRGGVAGPGARLVRARHGHRARSRGEFSGGSIDQVEIQAVSLDGDAVDLQGKDTLFPASARGDLRSGDVLTLWFDATDAGKDCGGDGGGPAVRPGGHVGGHHRPARLVKDGTVMADLMFQSRSRPTATVVGRGRRSDGCGRRRRRWPWSVRRRVRPGWNCGRGGSWRRGRRGGQRWRRGRGRRGRRCGSRRPWRRRWYAGAGVAQPAVVVRVVKGERRAQRGAVARVERRAQLVAAARAARVGRRRSCASGQGGAAGAAGRGGSGGVSIGCATQPVAITAMPSSPFFTSSCGYNMTSGGGYQHAWTETEGTHYALVPTQFLLVEMAAAAAPSSYSASEPPPRA